jgi:hypothetical protein
MLRVLTHTGLDWTHKHPAAIAKPSRRLMMRQLVYEGLREDKPAAQVRPKLPHPKN